MSNLSPICLFAYNRPNETKMCLNHLSKCKLAKKSELFIFIDGPRSKLDFNLCNQNLIPQLPTNEYNFKRVINNYSDRYGVTAVFSNGETIYHKL